MSIALPLKRYLVLLFVLVATAFFLCCGISYASDVRGGYYCYYTTEPITIDGKISEPAWGAAPVLDFAIPAGGGVPVSPTEGRLLWDEAYLYVSFKAIDKDIWSTLTERDSATFRNDVLEIFVKPPAVKEKYYNFEINALGTVFDARNAPGIPWEVRKQWDCKGLEHKITIKGTLNQRDDKDSYWQMEVAIPFSSLPVYKQGTPRPGEQWRFHLARYDYSVYLPDDGKELSSCAPLEKVDFHRHEDWLPLVFKK